MKQHLWDLVIVGSGPAGSAAAVAALASDPARSVLMLDRSDFPRDKCCGDAVLDAAFAELERYGVTRDQLVSNHDSVDTFRIVSPRGTQVLGRIACPVTVVPRAVLDANLCAAARDAGAVWKRHTVRAVYERGTHVQIDDNICARVVIGADGAESVIRRSLIGSRRRDVAVAIRGYDATAGDDVPTILLDDRPGLAYAWRFPSTGDQATANVGYGHLLADGEVANRAALLQKLDLMIPGLHIDPTTLRAHRLPLSTSRQLVARGRILLAGDAASLVNPISGEGIYYAIASGLAAGVASVVGRPSPAEHYRAALRRRFARHHRHVAALAQVIRSGALLDAGLRAGRRNDRVFEDIAALGLGEGSLTPRLVMGMVAEAVRGSGRTFKPPGFAVDSC